MSKQTELAQVADTITVDSGNVGIGTSSPSLATASGSATGLEISGSVPAINLNAGSSDEFLIYGGSSNANILVANNNPLRFLVGGSEAMRIDSSGNLLVGKTSANATDVGIVANANGRLYATASGDSSIFNRTSSDGDIVSFRKDGTTEGRIGVFSSRLFIYGDSGLRFGAGSMVPVNSNGSDSDNDQDLGAPTVRFDDIYATNGTIQTSDANEKQDIAELSDAEQRVAVACKGLLRKFRWRDAVEAKGDDARTHFGIIAQDLQAAFAAEGLDAGDYAMFISSTWTDEETGEERTRMGVRYSELLAFIIGAL